jgi:feruloyl esterase
MGSWNQRAWLAAVEAWDVGGGHPNAANTTLMAGALAYEFFTPPDPSFRIASFDVDRDPERMTAFSEVYDTFRDATLAAFSSRGGKLLMFHGMADAIFSPLESIDYYQRLAANHGGIDRVRAWARLFLVPGMNHCSGGPATDSFDGLGAIVDWVERNQAPERVLATALPTNRTFPNRTRPLCPFPTYAQYIGRGDVERAESFVCAQQGR